MSERPLKVLHVVHALGMGGAETWLMETLRYSSKTGAALRMDFLATSGKRGLFDDEAEQLGARVHYVRYGRRHLFSFVRRFRRLLAEGRYDAIHDHADYVSGWHFLMGVGRLPPVRVTHVHTAWLHIEAHYGVSSLRRRTANVGRRLVNRFASNVCGTSQDVLDKYGFHNGSSRPGRAAVLHCGIDLDRFAASAAHDRQDVRREFGWPDDTKVVLFVGRLDQSLTFDHPQNLKNSWFALNVVRATMAKDARVRFLVAGAGDEARRELEDRVKGWALEGNVRFLGVRRDVPRLMRAADVLLFPSRQEGLGMAAVEAQASGLPVLASTAVPRECIVVPQLYASLSLDEPLEAWADGLLRRIGAPRPAPEACLRAVASSPFSIAESSRRLREIYAGGTPA